MKVLSSKDFFLACNTREHMRGVSVRLTMPDIIVAVTIVIENSLKTRPIMPLIKTSGINTAASESVILKIVKLISRADAKVAAIGDSPKSSIRRTVFSRNTMASSTRKPIAIVSPIKLKLFMEKPKDFIKIKVKTSENGRAIAGMIVSLIRPKNRNMTITTSTKAITIVPSTSLMLSNMSCERS